MEKGRPWPAGRERQSGQPEEPAESRLVSLAVLRAKDGDREAFAFLYARFADDVCRYAASILRNHHEAEEVTQQVFTKLFAVIDKYEQREVPFLAWMLRVTRNVAFDGMRRQRTVPVAEVRGMVPTRVGEPREREVAAALAELSAAQREVMVLHHLAGLSAAEIAHRTGRTEGAVHGLHHRGRKALVKDLSARGVAPVTRVARTSNARGTY